MAYYFQNGKKIQLGNQLIPSQMSSEILTSTGIPTTDDKTLKCIIIMILILYVILC